MSFSPQCKLVWALPLFSAISRVVAGLAGALVRTPKKQGRRGWKEKSPLFLFLFPVHTDPLGYFHLCQSLHLVIMKTKCRLGCVSRILSIKSREVVFLCVALVRLCVVCCIQFWVLSTGVISASWSESTKTCRGRMTYKDKQRKDTRQQTQISAWEITARYKEENLHRRSSQTPEAAQKYCGILSLEVFNFESWTRWPPSDPFALKIFWGSMILCMGLSKCLTQPTLPL